MAIALGICAAMLVLGATALHLAPQDVKPSYASDAAPSPLSQVGLVAVWTAYVLAVFFRRPQSTESADR